MKDKFLLFASCIPVKGAKQNLICDIQRNFIYPIPDSLYHIVTKYQGYSLQDIKYEFHNEHDEVIDEYFKQLEERELIFYTQDIGLFPPLSMEWDEPFAITNAIADLSIEITNCLEFICQLKEIGCHSLQIRVFSCMHINEINEILNFIAKGRISTVELLLKYDNSFSLDEIKELCENFHRVSIVTIYSSPHTGYYHYRKNQFGHIFFIDDEISSEKCCGIITSNSFTINIKTFTEAQHHNTCLNRKISIDTEGNIKNCPSMKESYGNIRETTLMEALEKPGFKKYWNINKDQIEVCKDCEFRYICTDCRAYIEDPENILSKPLKCGYNPYTCEWEEWSTNPLKQKAIEYYGMQDLVKKEEIRHKSDIPPS